MFTVWGSEGQITVRVRVKVRVKIRVKVRVRVICIQAAGSTL